MSVLEDLSEEEAYLWALLSDISGLDQAEFLWFDAEQDDGCFRAWAFQWDWWRCNDSQQIDQAARSVGKSLSIKVRAFAFPFVNPGAEMVITAPEGVHLEAVTDNVETQFLNTRIGVAMLKGGRSHGSIKHKPFHMNFNNGARIMGRIPQHDGKGMKGTTTKGALVLTKNGFVSVEDVRVGDFVWSHQNRWSEVIDTYSFERDSYYKVSGQGAFDFTVTDEHRFYTRHDESKQPGKRKLGQLTWDWADDMPHSNSGINSYWTGVTNFGDPIEFDLPEQTNQKQYDFSTDSFWWVVGRYLAGGNPSSDRFNICAHPKDHVEIIGHLDNVNIGSWLQHREHSSADMIQCGSKNISQWLKANFGDVSHNKELPVWVFTLPKASRQALLDGYVAGDGNVSRHGTQDRICTSSASKKLTLGMGTLASTLGYSIGYSVVKVSDYVSEIGGIPLKKEARDAYVLRMNKTGRAIFENDFVHYKISSCERESGQSMEFYGIVTEDHSYLADGIIHHNTHPLWLELDEAQDFPEKGWTEIFETVKRGSAGAMWRAHGVTRGGRDAFFKFTQEAAGWTVHRWCLPGDTLVYGLDGPVRIEDIEVGQNVYSVNESDLSLTSGVVTGKVCTGVRPTWKIVTRDRELAGTFNHPVMVLKDSTKRKRTSVEVEWRDLSMVNVGDYVVEFVEGFQSNFGEVTPSISCEMDKYSVCHGVPDYIWRSSRDVQVAFLNGYLIADGSMSRQSKGQDAIAINAASEILVRELRVLAQYLGFRTTRIRSRGSWNPAKTEMFRFYIYEDAADFRQFPSDCTTHKLKIDKRLAVRKVLESYPTGERELTWDIEVGDKHNFVAEGIVTHNTAMHRPTWSDAERETAIANYGSREHPDYKRNILGLHGDASAPFFELRRLMACFLGDTKVITPDGEKLIKDLQVADSVLNAFGEAEILSVIESETDTLCKVMIDGEETICTPEHPFFTQDGWKHADQLREGDRVFRPEEILRMVQEGVYGEEQEILRSILLADLAR